MTPKQTTRLRKKIAAIKRVLAAEKRKFRGYDDSAGRRYLPPQYFIKLEDYPGGLTYLRWFDKDFPDDIGFPDFLFEWTLILFKTGHIKEAEKKAFQTFCSNTYLLDKFFGRPIIPVDKWEGSNLEMPGYADSLGYDSEQAELADFAEWLTGLLSEEAFKTRCERFIALEKKLKKEDDTTRRMELIRQKRELRDNW